MSTVYDDGQHHSGTDRTAPVPPAPLVSADNRPLATQALRGSSSESLPTSTSLGNGSDGARHVPGAAAPADSQPQVWSPPGPTINLSNLTNLTSTRARADTVNSTGNDADYFRFTLTAARRMRFELRNLSANANLFLHDASGRVVRRSTRGGTAVDSIEHTLAAGTYYVRVDAVSSGTIRYQLRYDLWPRAHGPVVNLGNLTGVSAARTRAGTVNSTSNDADYFRFTLTAARTMRFELRNLGANANLFLHDASGRVVRRSTRGGTAVDSIERTLAAGTYYVRVDAVSSGTIRYQLRYGPWHIGYGPVVSLGNLTGVAAARTRAGTVNSASDDADSFRFTLTAARTMRFELRNLGANANLYLHDASGSIVGRSTRGGTAEDSIERALAAGTYYVRVDAVASGTIRYQLRYGPWSIGLGPTVNLGNLTNVTTIRRRSGTVSRTDGSGDAFRFTTTALRTMSFELHGLSGDADLYLLDASGDKIASSILNGTDVDSIVLPLAAGTYFIQVNAWAGGTIAYQLRYRSGHAPPGGTRETAANLGDLTNLSLPLSVSDTVHRTDNADDYYRFSLTNATSRTWFELSRLSAGAFLYLYDASGRQIARDYGSTAGSAIISPTSPLAPGTYFVRVSAASSNTVTQYRITYGNGPMVRLGDLTHRSDLQSRAGTVNRTDNDVDYYRFSLTTRSALYVTLTGLTADADLYLHDASGRQVAASALAGAGSRNITRTLNPGRYYIRVDADETNTDIEYRLTYVNASVRHLGDLSGVSGIRSVQGTVSRTDNNSDYYRFTVGDATSRTWFELSGLNGNVGYLQLHDASGRTIMNRRISSSTGAVSVSPQSPLAPGTYFIHVQSTGDASIRYRLSYVSAPVIDLSDLTARRDLGTQVGTVNATSNDADYYRFTLTTRSAMYFTLTGLSADADLYLHDASGRQIATSAFSDTRSRSFIRTLAPGSYFVRVDADAANADIEYRLTYVNAPVLHLGDLSGVSGIRSATGTVHWMDNRYDYYRFSLTEATTRTWFELSGLSANATLHLYDASGRAIASSTSRDTSPIFISPTDPLTPGTYFIRVDAASINTVIQYRLTYVSAPVVDLRDLSTTRNLGTQTGTVNATSNDADYYRFTLTTRSAMYFTLSGLSADADLYLHDSSGRQIAESALTGTGPRSFISTLDPGSYYVRVDADAANTDIEYRLTYVNAPVLHLGDLSRRPGPHTVSGTVNRGDNEVDYYRFTLTGSASRIRYDLTGLSAHATLELRDASGRLIVSDSGSGGPSDPVGISPSNPLPPGTYFIGVRAATSNTLIRYELSYRPALIPNRQTAAAVTPPATPLAPWREDVAPPALAFGPDAKRQLGGQAGTLAL